MLKDTGRSVGVAGGIQERVLGLGAILDGIQELFPEPGALRTYQPILTSPWRLSSCVLNSALARS